MPGCSAIAAQQLDTAIGEKPGPVPGHRPAHTVDDGEGARSLLRIAEVAKRNEVAPGQPTFALTSAELPAATTPVSEPGVNVATAVGADCVDSALICRPVSDAPALSITRRFGSAVTKRRRTLGVSAAPPLLIETSPDRS